MRLKGQLARLFVLGGMAVMTAGISQAGGGCWCGNPAPKAVSQPVTAQTSLALVLWTILPALM